MTGESQNNAAFFLGQIEINAGEEICDVGCGTGYYTYMIKKLTNRKVVGLDLSRKMLEIARSKCLDE